MREEQYLGRFYYSPLRQKHFRVCNLGERGEVWLEEVSLTGEVLVDGAIIDVSPRALGRRLYERYLVDGSLQEQPTGAP